MVKATGYLPESPSWKSSSMEVREPRFRSREAAEKGAVTRRRRPVSFMAVLFCRCGREGEREGGREDWMEWVS